MASAGKPTLDDSRRATGSPKMKARGCAFNHDPHKVNTTYQSDRLAYPGSELDSSSWNVQLQLVVTMTYVDCTSSNNSRRRLNVDSPSFTPSLLSSNGSSPTTASVTAKKAATISPKAANAAPFQPRNITSRMS
ncbi:unnamed protein product [Aspergillus oryzae]|uniref:Unnamed protein product n=2 Tax=Aspergillus oryzae TaxID=5062 RepID=A0AAN4YW55_ASPOZ|nr:unnamed protein product [Aspergillus oryzae]GMF89750.1 unnamed protein product [Aspergillus oryzae]GMG16554.1 unnamed protein product [Aspergillus oryzae]GMG38035.1 unnamed protein product [Aspergillus oryzae]GMG51394.1 unnamed protein product [Aspergillus oryzae var. brunneus]